MTQKQITLDAAEGKCDAYLATPGGIGPWPAVLVYPDAMGVRPAMREIADRIAKWGYFVMLPDIFYRTPGQVPDPASFFSDADVRSAWQKNVVPTVTAANVMADTAKFIDFLASQQSAQADTIGITGYCMGGRLAVYAAGHFGARVAGAAAFHPGGLATDAPDSPHRLAKDIKGEIYVGGAMDDRSFDDAQKDRLRAAFDEAGVEYTLETYPAKHGWVPADTPAHDAAQAERHFENAFRLFESALSGR
jgi:carboxymethylenebutenolidase